MSQALKFAGDFKLGHYMKIPPRTMFWCQIVATVIAGTVQLGVQSWYVLYECRPLTELMSSHDPSGCFQISVRLECLPAI